MKNKPSWKSTFAITGSIVMLCVISGLIGWGIGDPDQYWEPWHYTDVPSDNETMTILLYEEQIISATHNGTRWEIEVKPTILYHINRPPRPTDNGGDK